MTSLYDSKFDKPLSESFSQSVAPEKTPKRKRKRLAPLSLRLTADERRRVEDNADGMALNAYIKSKLFADAPQPKKRKRRTAIDDYELLARVLSALGRSELFSKLDSLIEQAESGQLNLDAQQMEQLALACACVIQMRDELVRSLGLKPK
nr:hypothetical protein [uncultured Cohaesibacter sp.]